MPKNYYGCIFRTFEIPKSYPLSYTVHRCKGEMIKCYHLQVTAIPLQQKLLPSRCGLVLKTSCTPRNLSRQLSRKPQLMRLSWSMRYTMV